MGVPLPSTGRNNFPGPHSSACLARRKAVVITGCSHGGIGDSLAREFHSHGLRVFATARSLEKITNLKELGIECLTLEVNSHDSVVRCYKEVEAAVGSSGVAFLVNNAGIVHSQPATEMPLATAHAIFDTNFFGVMDMNQTFLPLLRNACGTIVHIGSLASIAPVPWQSVYCASKAALYAYCDTLRLEVATLGVKVIYVQTGMVQTNMSTERSTVAEDSLYASVRKAHEESRRMHGANGISSEVYAKDVVGKLLGPGSWWKNEWELWAGDKATVMKTMKWIAGNSPWDLWGFVMRKTYKLE